MTTPSAMYRPAAPSYPDAIADVLRIAEQLREITPPPRLVIAEWLGGRRVLRVRGVRGEDVYRVSRLAWYDLRRLGADDDGRSLWLTDTVAWPLGVPVEHEAVMPRTLLGVFAEADGSDDRDEVGA